MTSNIHRRAFLARFAAGAGCFIAAAGTPFSPFVRPARAAVSVVTFPQGIASGDPEPDAVILWTRAQSADGGAVSLVAQMSRDPKFSQVIVERPVVANAASDHTIRLIVHELDPNAVYYYRFLTHDGASVSPTGRTRTAPARNDPRAVNFAFLCCQSYEQGFYGAYRRLVRDDEAAAPGRQLDFVLHLGDFIYEVRGDRPDIDPADPAWLTDRNNHPRAIPPFPDGSAAWTKHPWGRGKGGAHNAVSLADYRHLYKLYLSDPDLQAARARFPFIHTWDDHEFTNDCWQTACTYGGESTPAATRKVAAAQSFFEFIPIILSDAPGTAAAPNPARDFVPVTVSNSPFEGPDADWRDKSPDNRKALESITIYRTLRWGQNLDLVITDLRSYRSPQVFDAEMEKATELPLPPLDLVRTLDAGHKSGRATVKVKNGEIANPRRNTPPGTMMGPAQKEWFKAALKSSDATWKVWANSVPAMALRIDLSSIPFAGYPDVASTTDSWGGYPGELGELMAFVAHEGIANLISCTGDHHMHAAALLCEDPDAPEPKPVAAEFLCAGISSSSMFNEFEYGSRNSPAFRALVTYDSQGHRVENLNATFLEGCVSAIVRSYTNSGLYGRLAPSRINPHLAYTDANSNGFAIVRLNAHAADAELVTVQPTVRDYGPAGAPVLRTAKFRLAAWGKGTPALEGPLFEGTPPMPFV
jgi:alkaline phosphatase D